MKWLWLSSYALGDQPMAQDRYPSSMSQTVAAQKASAKTITDSASILLYSDNAALRREVRLAVGDTLGQRRVQVEWTEVATHEMAMMYAEKQPFDLVIGDNETTKLGGVGLTRQMRHELDWQPNVLLLLARQQDAWLAAWSGADGAMQRPLDPFALRRRVTEMLGLTDR